MIQRIQTLWLFLATTALLALFLFPYIQFTDATGVAKAIKITGLYHYTGTDVVLDDSFTVLTIATVLVALLPLIIVFFYANRKKQLTFSYLTIVVILVYTFWLVQTAKSVIEDIQLEFQNYGIGVMLPSVAILFVVLAIRGIRRDEKLVKSADRLR
ncbi:DUF4293 domain-containing protein [Desertivirga xinjiangensis]|uniref:DUF4293 domain-containing protein n=1 Tax=Desertivirga xinjiangensis TaxID=539206 RepID=UPI0021094A83|nr:DUF4293 domain-containing protein [Pedobacter xinjiangensis]